MVSELPTRRQISGRLVAVALGLSLATSLVLPQTCWGQVDRHPGLEGVPRVTVTKRGIPGDPLNVAFVGSLEDLHLDMLEAGWFPADPITLKSSLKIVAGTVFHRSYVDAPVSNLMVWGRRQDLAFEQPVGKDPRRRHHVRFWRAPT